MGSICFSSVPILRCDLLSLSQNIALVIPVVLEALSTTTLFLKLWSRRQLLLTCESWIYLLLAMVQLISQSYPPMRQGLDTFRNFDTVIGLMSFMPILLYSSFLCSLIIFEFMDLVSARLRTVVIFCLIFFIPLLVGMNQAASFIGISYDFSPLRGPAIGFEDRRGRSMWMLFTDLTLGFFTSFQMIVWCFVAFRVAQILLEQRRLDYRPGAGFPRIGGIGWIIIGIKLAATETMIGFAGSGFKFILARRIMRCVSRTLLCMGLLWGSNPHRNAYRRRKSQLEPTFCQPEVIKTYASDNRLSAFHNLSPTATTFFEKHAVPYRRWSQPGTFPLTMFKNLSSNHQRATIHFDNGIPKLQLRLSGIDLPNPMASRITSWQSNLPYPRDRPFTVHEYHSSLDLGDVEIVSVPRTTYVPEKAKPTLYRSASGRTLVRPASGYVIDPLESSQNDEDRSKQPEESKRETPVPSNSTQDWLVTNLPAPPPTVHAKMYSLDHIQGIPASVSAPELVQVDSPCADILQGVMCISSWSLDTGTSESSMVSGALADEGNSVYHSARTSLKRSTLSLYEPLRKSNRNSLQFKKLDTPPRDVIVPPPSPPHTPLVMADNFVTASVPSHAEQRSITHKVSSWSFDTATSQSSMIFRAPTNESVPAHESTQEGEREAGQHCTNLLHVPQSSSKPESSTKLERSQPKPRRKAVQNDVVPTVPPSPVEMYSLKTSPGHVELTRNASSLSLDTATSESSMVFRAPSDESIPASNSTPKGGRGTGKQKQNSRWLHTPWEEPWRTHHQPHLTRKLEPPPQPQLPCDLVQDGAVRMQSPSPLSPAIVEGLDTVSVLSQWESLPARPESDVIDIGRGMDGGIGSVPWGVPTPTLPAVPESPRLKTCVETDDGWQSKRIIVHVTQSSIDDRL